VDGEFIDPQESEFCARHRAQLRVADSGSEDAGRRERLRHAREPLVERVERICSAPVFVTRPQDRVGRLAAQDHHVTQVAAEDVVRQVSNTPIVTWRGACPVATLDLVQPLSEVPAGQFECRCTIHDVSQVTLQARPTLTSKTMSFRPFLSQL
jgi:hypothetical protein